MITRIHAKNFRGLGDVDVRLGNLTALVGRNGAGKSSFIDVLRFVRDSLNGNLEDAVLTRHGLAAIRRWAPTKPYDIEVELEVQTRSFSGVYGFVLASGRDGDFVVKSERCELRTGADKSLKVEFERKADSWIRLPVSEGKRTPFRTTLDPRMLALSAVSIFHPEMADLMRYLRSISFYSIYPNTLREPQKPSNGKLLSDHGENLATVLKKMTHSSKDKVLEALRTVVSDVRNFKVQHVGGFLVVQLEHAMSEKQSAWFDLSQESDGTLRLLGLLVALYQVPSRRMRQLIAIEEPELTLHPGAIAVICDLLKTASGKQILIATQSPDVISSLSVDDLRVVERSVGGVTSINPIAEHQREAVNEQLFTTGDLMRIEGLIGQSR